MQYQPVTLCIVRAVLVPRVGLHRGLGEAAAAEAGPGVRGVGEGGGPAEDLLHHLGLRAKAGLRSARVARARAQPRAQRLAQEDGGDVLLEAGPLLGLGPGAGQHEGAEAGGEEAELQQADGGHARASLDNNKLLSLATNCRISATDQTGCAAPLQLVPVNWSAQAGVIADGQKQSVTSVEIPLSLKVYGGIQNVHC